MNTGKFIKEIQKQNGLSQEKMASILKVSRPTYIKIINGDVDITLNQAKTLCSRFELSLEELEQGERKGYTRVDKPLENKEKFTSVMLYILDKIGAKPNVGQTVIYKILYFLDFDYYEKHEKQLMGLTYIKNTYGPTPKYFNKYVKELNEKGIIEIVKSKYFGKDQTKYLPIKTLKKDKLTAIEIAFIDSTLEELQNKTAKELCDFSHLDVPWIGARIKEEIEYEAVFYRDKNTSISKRKK